MSGRAGESDLAIRDRGCVLVIEIYVVEDVVERAVDETFRRRREEAWDSAERDAVDLGLGAGAVQLHRPLHLELSVEAHECERGGRFAVAVVQTDARVLEWRVLLRPRRAAWYSDRHSCFSRNDKEPWTLAEQLAQHREPTQVGRALQQLGVRLILAHSPQAKGRIERCWETLQDRFVKALRRAGATTIDEANALVPVYLARHHARFAIAPADRADAHRRLPRSLDLDGVCSLHYVRTVANDNTVRLEERLVQIPPGPRRRSYARCRVALQERLDGALVVVYQDAIIARQPAVSGTVLVARRRRRGRELAADPPRPTRPPPEPIVDADLAADLFVPLVTGHPWRRAPLLQPHQNKEPQPLRAEALLSVPSKDTIISTRITK